MTAQNLTRTSYRDANGDERGGDTSRKESNWDVEQYLQPMERLHGSELHEWGVASGLRVTATVNQAGVTVAPGVALDAQGRHLSLAAGGQARLDGTTLADVGPAGVTLPTPPGQSGEWYLTIGFAETFDSAIPGAPRVDHTPLLQRYRPADLPADGSRVVLARVVLDPAGNVADLGREQRRGAGLPAERVVLRRPVRTASADGLAVEQRPQPAAVLRARAAGGLELRVESATDEVDFGRDEGGAVRGFARLAITAQQVVARRDDGTPALTVDAAAGNVVVGSAGTGRVGVGTAAPDQRLTVEGTAGAYLNVRAKTAIAGGPAEILLGADVNGGIVSTMTNHDLRLRAGGNVTRMIVKNDGKVGIGTTAPAFPLDVAGRIQLRQAGHASAGLWLRQDSAGALGAFVGMADNDRVGLWGDAAGFGLTMHTRTGQVGIGVHAPNADARLDVRSAEPSGTVIEATNATRGVGVFASVPDGTAVFAVGGAGTGVIAGGEVFAAILVGDVNVTGTVNKAAGRIRIDHPEAPETRTLSHALVESDELKTVYDGVVELDAGGAAEVELAGWCDTLNREFRYQLTPIGAAAPDLHVAEEVAGNRFRIAGGRAGMRVCWQLTGVRRDPYAKANPLVVDEEKPADEQGTYLHPDLYDQPAERGTAWRLTRRATPNRSTKEG
ncbi:hypothetical protein ACTMTJ_09735 [Phytohabitans sp. LJ34]|uniref:hypothetical protein n=1 Tax=Phytohabitans sp. LJ34 TaxID=3452217 RepID=UPI003F8CDDEF